jgi:4-amino-4-deoxy-L-arabinose transferase-like glycosyltransferase
MQEIYISSIEKKVNIYLLFFLVCLFLYLPSSFFRKPFYPDEVRNLYIAKNISKPKDFLFPKHFDKIYYEKPPLYFWILKLFSNILPNYLLFLPILFNILVSWGILLVNYLLLKEEGFAQIGIFSSFLLSTTGIFYGMSILTRMDLLFLFFIFLSLYFWWLSVKKDRTIFIFLSSFFSFLAVFTKGILGIIFPLFIELGMSIYLKDKKILKRVIFLNILVCLGIISWLLSFSYIEKNYFRKMVIEQTIYRAFSPFAVHRQSIFFYFPFLFIVFLPWSFFGLGYFLTFFKRKIFPCEMLFLLWFLGGFVILSLIRSKLPMYLLLLSIPFCVLITIFLFKGEEQFKKGLLLFTEGFFIISWIGAFIYFIFKDEFIPISSFFSIFLFLIIILINRKKSFFVQFKNLFIIWIIIIQIVNFFYLPLASENSGYNKIVKTIGALKINFDTIYVDDKSLCQINIYPAVNKPVIFFKKREEIIFKRGRFIVISKDTKLASVFKKISKIDNFYILYKG